MENNKEPLAVAQSDENETTYTELNRLIEKDVEDQVPPIYDIGISIKNCFRHIYNI